MFCKYVFAWKLKVFLCLNKKKSFLLAYSCKLQLQQCIGKTNFGQIMTWMENIFKKEIWFLVIQNEVFCSAYIYTYQNKIRYRLFVFVLLGTFMVEP